MTAVVLAAPYSQFLDNNGLPLNGGLVYSYFAGTTTPQATYTDASGSVQASNPIVLDASGRTTIWVSGVYRFDVKDSLGNLIRTTDNVTALNSGGDMTKAVYDPANISQQLVGISAVQTLTNKTINVTVNSLNLAPITASLIADVALNNIANYFDGPAIAQGTAGQWWVSGTVTLTDTGTTPGMQVKLWDGSTVIASTSGLSAIAGSPVSICLSGFISNPVGNIRISVKDPSATTGKILFNASGNSKDSTISAFRIA